MTLLALTGCDRQEYVVEHVSSPVVITAPDKTAPGDSVKKDAAAGTTAKADGEKSDKPADKADAPKSEIPVLTTAFMIDGFEGPESTVWGFDSADDEGIAQYVTAGATQGKKALKITLKDKGRAGKFNLRRDVNLDLSHAASLVLDFNAPSDKFTLAVALTCGPHDIYQESKAIELKQGANTNLRIPLTGNSWKNEKSKWEYTSPPVNLQFVQRISLLIFTNGESAGSIVLDNLRVEPDETPLLSSGGMVLREWRPQLLGILGVPKTVRQYEGVEAFTFFRASYRDFFDSNDIAAGMRIYSPSGKTIDVRAFFDGMMNAPKEVRVEKEGAPLTPLWGPVDLISKPDAAAPKKKKGGGKGAAKKNAEKAEKEKEEAKDPVKEAAKEAELKKAIEQTADLRIKSTTKLPVWCMRFTPVETGQYTLQVYVQNAAGETRSEERKLTVLPERKNPATPGRWGGNVRVSKRDPHQFELQNGDPFYVYGQNVCWTRDWTPYLDKMKDYGANTVRIWLCPWGLNLERKTEPGSYDLETAERIDHLVADAEARGIRIIFCFTFHGMNQGNWGDSPYNVANGGPCARAEDFFTNYKAKQQFKRLLSYSASRWSSSPAIFSWELMNEIDLAKFSYFDEAIHWAREMAGHLKGVDPHGHLVTVSATLRDAPMELWTDSRIDWVQIHAYGKDVSNLMFERISPFQTMLKPVLMGEFGGGTESRDDIPDQDGARLQASLWVTACSPSCGAAMPWWWDTYIETRNLYPVMAATKKFVAGEDRRGRFGNWVKKMYDFGVEVSGSMDAQGGRFYVSNPEWVKNPDFRKGPLIPKDQKVELTGLNDGLYTVEFWDAKDGTIFNTQPALVSEGKLTITLSARASEFAIKIDKKERNSIGLK